jgi:hypothetical protein
MRITTAVVVLIACLGVMQGHTAPSGVELIVRVEARRLADQDVTEQTTRIIESQLPAGGAEVKYLTDGQAVRSTISGRMFGFENGTVRLVPHGSSDVYVLNPTDRTYYLLPGNWRPFGGQKPEFHFQPTRQFKTILGYKARHVTGWYRVDAPPFPGQRQYVHEVRADIDDWCVSTLRIPDAMTRMMDLAQRLLGGADNVYKGVCPLTLESTVKTSVLPGYEIVSRTQSIRPSRLPPGTFRLPDGYRQVSKDGGGAPQ